jgi:hypothetical protein
MVERWGDETALAAEAVKRNERNADKKSKDEDRKSRLVGPKSQQHKTFPRESVVTSFDFTTVECNGVLYLPDTYATAAGVEFSVSVQPKTPLTPTVVKVGDSRRIRVLIGGNADSRSAARKRQLSADSREKKNIMICKKCNVPKSKGDFSESAKKKGRSGWCKDCTKKKKFSKPCSKCNQFFDKEQYSRRDWDLVARVCKICSN